MLFRSNITQGGQQDILVARFLPSGILDPDFGDSGKVVLALSTNTDSANSIALQSNGKILIGGGTIDGNAHDTFVKWRPKQGDDQQALRKMGAEGVPVSSRVFGSGHWLRPALVQEAV